MSQSLNQLLSGDTELLLQDSSTPGNVTATLRNVVHGKMQPIPAFVSTACAEVIKKALSRRAKSRITLDELAGNSWVRTKAAEFEQQLLLGTVRKLPVSCHSSHVDMSAQWAGQHVQSCSVCHEAYVLKEVANNADNVCCWSCCTRHS